MTKYRQSGQKLIKSNKIKLIVINNNVMFNIIIVQQ